MLILLHLALAGDRSTYAHPSGVSMTVPQPASGMVVEQLVAFYWPGDVTFTPNLNVQRQQFVGGVDAYLATSLAQFGAMGLTSISTTKEQRGKHGAIRMEYSGDVGTGPLHFGALAVDEGASVVLATCTANEAQWPRVAPMCKIALDSLKVP